MALGLFETIPSLSVFSNGASLTATQVGYGDAAGKIAGESTFALTATGTDATLLVGSLKIGFAASGTSTSAYFYNSGVSSPQNNYAVRQDSDGTARINANSGRSLILAINGTTKGTLNASSFTFATGVPVTISDTTASTTTGTGCLVLSGGLGVAGQLFIGNTINGTGAVLSGSFACGTATKTGDFTGTTSDGVIFLDATSGNVTYTMPAANGRGAGKSQVIHVVRIDASGNTVSIARTGSDTINGGTTAVTLAATIGTGKTLVSNGSNAWYVY